MSKYLFSSKTLVATSVAGLLLMQGAVYAYTYEANVRLYNDSGYSLYQPLRIEPPFEPKGTSYRSPVGTLSGYSCNFNTSTAINCGYKKTVTYNTPNFTEAFGFVYPDAKTDSRQRAAYIDPSCLDLHTGYITTATKSVELQVHLRQRTAGLGTDASPGTNLVTCNFVYK